MSTITQNKTERTLNALDRCDRCGSQAYVAYIKGTQELLFCNHHNDLHYMALGEWAETVLDERYKLFT